MKFLACAFCGHNALVDLFSIHVTLFNFKSPSAMKEK